jgi:DNA primase
VMFPIRNRTGEVTGFGARALGDEEPKYLNSPQTLLFDKSGTLYGLDQAKDAIRDRNLAVIVEGYMDVIGAHQAGFLNVVASLGTALTEKQLGLLKRLTNRYALALDPDAAGEEATKRGLEVAREALDRKTVPIPMGAGLIKFEDRLEAELLVIALPAGRDPDEIVHDEPGEWARLVERAEPIVDFYFRVRTQDLDLTRASDKSVGLNRLAPIIQEIQDSNQRAHYTQQLARFLHVPEKTVEQELSKSPARLARREPIPAPPTTDSPATPEARLETYVLTLALKSPGHLGRIQFLDGEDFAGAETRALFGAWRHYVAESAPVDLSAFREILDEMLRPLYDMLAGRVSSLSALSELELVREIETTALRLQQNRDKDELTQVELLLRDQDSAELDEKKLLYERAEILRRRLAENQKAMNARTMFKTRAPSLT